MHHVLLRCMCSEASCKRKRNSSKCYNNIMGCYEIRLFSDWAYRSKHSRIFAPFYNARSPQPTHTHSAGTHNASDIANFCSVPSIQSISPSSLSLPLLLLFLPQPSSVFSVCSVDFFLGQFGVMIKNRHYSLSPPPLFPFHCHSLFPPSALQSVVI